MSRLAAATAIAAAALVTLTACGGTSNPLAQSSGTPARGTVVVGSANFPENVLLGEIYAQALEAKGVHVTRRLNVGSREIIYGAIRRGEIGVLPEYNGALLAYLDRNATETTTAQVDAALKKKLPPNLTILDSARAQDKDALTVNKATADTYHLTAIPDLKPVAGRLVLGGPPEFETRRQGVVGLASVYGLTFKRFRPLDTAGPVTVAALRKNQIQVANLFTTDPSIVENGFVVLQDPKNLFGAQNVTPLVNTSVLTPTLENTLNAVSAELDISDLLGMMKKVSIDKDDPATVAAQWLKANGLA